MKDEYELTVTTVAENNWHPKEKGFYDFTAKSETVEFFSHLNGVDQVPKAGQTVHVTIEWED